MLFVLPVLCVMLGYVGSAAAYKVTKICPDACGGPATIRCTNIQDSGCDANNICICVDRVSEPGDPPIVP